MDLFVRAMPPSSSEKDLVKFFRPYLAEFGIITYEINKFRNKPLANITILESTKGHLFLAKYGVHARPHIPLRMNGYLIKCSISHTTPTPIQLRTLASESARQLEKLRDQSGRSQPSKDRGATYGISSLACGVWTYKDDRLVFQPHFFDPRPGKIVFGARRTVILLQPDGQSADRIDINYYNVDTVLIGDPINPTISLTCVCPPKFYQQAQDSTAELNDLLARLNVNVQRSVSSHQQLKKSRFSSISDPHQLAAGMCFVYQARLSDNRDLAKIQRLVSHERNIQSSMVFPTTTLPMGTPLRDSMTRLNFELTDQARSGSLPFGVRFQVTRLAQNGKLSADETRGLLPCVNKIYHAFDRATTIHALTRLYLYLDPPGPHTEASQFSQAFLMKSLKDYAQAYDSTNDVYSLANRHSHIVLIHRLNVTPSGTYLEGPSAEVTNRVLREYPGHEDCFLRVSFMDEDGESVRFDPHSDLQKIYHGRFKAFLNDSYNIAGQGFSFLGFSHSSLRSQTCWFMSPFFINNKLMVAPLVIQSLGDFSQFRSPARCAARIGQAFTDTTGTIEIEPRMLVEQADIMRNDRVFSDGVGIISQSLLQRIWRMYGIRRALKPTVLQIRFAGAKGVVSLDSRLTEDKIVIRPSMNKFSGSRSKKVEICGAAFRPLPMILNRGYIKILEDLGVPIDVFMALQTAAVTQLEQMTSSTINASILLSTSGTSKTAQLPMLLEHLSDIGLNYHNDTYLRDIVDIVVMTKLRDIKYRGRIPVETGVTLYGIMDETGYLQEGEIYVVTDTPPQGGKQVLTGGRVLITRSPALHPGDVRIVRAIDVPDDSPLNCLSNCVVFSQHGARDLPSQLSGGDLDGDLYNVIFEPSLMPRTSIAEPADYPRVKPVELDRQVTSKDMSDFFVQFMETDQLGQISTIHVQLADQKPDGVFNPDCIKLAEMASTAVDFSKTGVPVDMRTCPRRDRNRPDFMAPSPRVDIASGGLNVLQENDDMDEEELENDPVSNLDPETRRIRYYKSDKALGHLYRAIDEHRFLDDLHNDRKQQRDPRENTLMPKLWDYVRRNNILLEWEHNRKLARQIRESYENTLLDILYGFAPSPHHPLTESELFAGTILGRAGGASSKRLREMTMTLRERFEEILDFTTSRIVYGDADGEDRNDEALPRAIACFAMGIEEGGLYDRKLGPLKSWTYITAGVCLREMQRWGQHVMLPPV